MVIEFCITFNEANLTDRLLINCCDFKAHFDARCSHEDYYIKYFSRIILFSSKESINSFHSKPLFHTESNRQPLYCFDIRIDFDAIFTVARTVTNKPITEWNNWAYQATNIWMFKRINFSFEVTNEYLSYTFNSY